MDIDAVCEGIANAINTAVLRVNDTQVTATAFEPESVTAPCFYTATFSLPYDHTFGALTEMTLTCRLIGARSDDRAGQKGLRALVSTGTGTLHATFRTMRGTPGQPALSGACHDLHLQNAEGPRLIKIGEPSYYAVDLTVLVIG